MFALSIIVCFIMLIVSLLHFYWAFGGKYGLMSAGPSLESGKNFIPSGLLIFVMACFLFCLAVLSIQLFSPIDQIKGYFISTVFVIRAIGNFKYVGFFKKVYNSNFAFLDTKYFSPMILFLGVAYAVLSSYNA